MNSTWPCPSLRVLRAFSGATATQRPGWSACRAAAWTLDCLVRGRQRQRVEEGVEFWREPRLAALYAPGTRYYEERSSGDVYEEVWMVFEADEQLGGILRGLTGDRSWCHILDPEELIVQRLRRLGELVLEQPAGHLCSVPGLALDLIGQLCLSRPIGDGTRLLSEVVAESAAADLVARTEQYIEAHLDRPVQVAELARQLNMSESAYAHAYPRQAGESPYQTILRLKMAAARQLLLRHGLSVKETAARLGFASEFNFSRAFKRHEGMPPSRFAARMRRK